MDIDTNHYSVPWKLIGAEVTVQVGGGQIRIHHAGTEVPATTRASATANARSIAPTCTASCRVVRTLRRCRRSGAARDRAVAALDPLIAGGGRRLVNAEGNALPAMLARLKLTVIRDRLDDLLDEAARGDLSLREALALLCRAEMSHREERRIQMGTGLAKFPHQCTLDGADLGF